MRRWFIIPFAVPLLAGCSAHSESSAPPRPVRAFEVAAGGNAAPDETLTGTVSARVDATLAFREGGRILTRTVDNGSVVAAGSLIARIDPADLAEGMAGAQAQALAARRTVDAARATADRAWADERRLRGLAEEGAIAARDYDAAIEGARAAQARLAAAEAQAAAASAIAREQANRRSYAELRAPFSGVVTAVHAEAGQVVAPGTPVIRLAQAGPREIVVDMPEQRRSAAPRHATGTLYGGGSFALEMRELAAAADPVTRTYRARYRVIGAEPPLGATVTVSFNGRTGSATRAIPLGALTNRGRGPGVWTIGSDGAVAWRRIALAGIDGERAYVAGLRPRERIVALGAHLIQPGERVRIAAMAR